MAKAAATTLDGLVRERATRAGSVRARSTPEGSVREPAPRDSSVPAPTPRDSSVPAPTPRDGSARDRLLAAANELFYAEGIHTVGIDRVIERAGVAKASLYSTFGSKDELVRAYLQGRADARQKRILDRIAKHDEPRAKILSIFGLLAELAGQPGFRGCAFVNASAEGEREGCVNEVTTGMRTWTRAVFVDLARQLGARDADELGRQLQLLYDGAIVSASMDRDPKAPLEAAATADMLIDAGLPARKARR